MEVVPQATKMISKVGRQDQKLKESNAYIRKQKRQRYLKETLVQPHLITSDDQVTLILPGLEKKIKELEKKIVKE